MQDADYFRHSEGLGVTLEQAEGLIFGTPPTTGGNKNYGGVLHFGGFTDWHLPSLIQLESINTIVQPSNGGTHAPFYLSNNLSPFVNILDENNTLFTQIPASFRPSGYLSSDFQTGNSDFVFLYAFDSKHSGTINILDDAGFVWAVRDGLSGDIPVP